MSFIILQLSSQLISCFTIVAVLYLYVLLCVSVLLFCVLTTAESWEKVGQVKGNYAPRSDALILLFILLYVVAPIVCVSEKRSGIFGTCFKV